MHQRAHFTVVTVNLNNLQGLEATAKSILDQDFEEFEWWVIDGGSTDGSVEFLERLSSSKLMYLSERDGGLYEAMNKGLDRAHGEYVIFLNSGDSFVDASVLRDVFHALGDTGIDILYGDAFESADGKLVRKRALPHWFVYYSMFSHHQAIFYRRERAQHLRYDKAFSVAADWAFTATLIQSGATAQRLRRPICVFARGGASQSPNTIGSAELELRRIHNDVLHTPPVVRPVLISLKLLVNRTRRRWPHLYDLVRARW